MPSDLPGTEAPSLVKLMPNARCLRHGAAVRLLFLPPSLDPAPWFRVYVQWEVSEWA